MTILKCLFTDRDPEITAVGNGDSMREFYDFNTAQEKPAVLQRTTIALITPV